MKHAGVALLTCFASAACGAPHDIPASDSRRLPWPAEVVPLLAPTPSDNPPSLEKTDLGRLLFFDPILSSDRQVACATCHSPYWGMADGLRFSVGVGGTGAVGPGRVGPTHTERHAPTLWNAAYRQSLFWDGRVSSLEEQMLVPLADGVELNRSVDELLADLGSLPGYVDRFRAAFPNDQEPVRLRNVQQALAGFVRSLVTSRAPYDQYVAGDPHALSPDEVNGMFVFARAGCADCHAPPLFESERYASAGIGRSEDEGRFAVTHREEDRGAMRVPTLRNLRQTAPYFHDGSAPTIENAVEIMSRAFGPHELPVGDVAAISLFLRKGLVDLANEPERPLAVPSGLSVPPDGLAISR